MKKLPSARDIEILALCLSIVWLLLAQLLAVLAWDSGLLSRQGAIVHWLLIGVLPPALALWTMPPPAPKG